MVAIEGALESITGPGVSALELLTAVDADILVVVVVEAVGVDAGKGVVETGVKGGVGTGIGAVAGAIVVALDAPECARRADCSVAEN